MLDFADASHIYYIRWDSTIKLFVIFPLVPHHHHHHNSGAIPISTT